LGSRTLCDRFERSGTSFVELRLNAQVPSGGVDATQDVAPSAEPAGDLMAALGILHTVLLGAA
jgi:hypothetical protein